jgi:phage tail-like protein
MASDTREDPVRGFNFEISLFDTPSSLGLLLSIGTAAGVIDRPAGGFSECTGLQTSLDVEDYEEGGNNGTVLKFPKRIKWNPITLKKGLGRGSELWDWFYSFVVGSGQRRDGIITLRDESHAPHSVWAFRRGLPVRWEGPSLNATHSEVAIQTIEIAHEGLVQLPVLGA